MGAGGEELSYTAVSGDAASGATYATDGVTEPIITTSTHAASKSHSWGKLGAVVAVAMAMAGVVAVSLHGSRAKRITVPPEELESKLAKKKASQLKEDTSSWFETSCLQTKACKCPGQVCYKKNKFWAMCMESCDKDIPEIDKDGKKHYWNCSELGERTAAAPKNGKCAGQNEDCRSSRCCQGKGMQCYSKNEYWATCMASCKKGIEAKDADKSPWECEELGPRTPGIEKNGNTEELSQCAWDQGNCLNSRCCRVQGSICFQKDNTWATCEKSCAQKPAMGGMWTCKVLGGAPDLPEPLTTSAPKGEASGDTLFCFTVVMPNTFEVALVGAQKKQKLGIFACDASALFQAAASLHGKSIKLIAIPKVFHTIWKEVKEDKQYLDYDWTVKVEPDVVFIPDRLKDHLNKLKAPKKPGIYVKNSHAKWGFIGAVQVYSKEAMNTYFKNHKECSKNMVTQSEDVYMMTCLDTAGVRYMLDDMMLNDQQTLSYVMDMKDLSYCGDIRFAAYHPYKDLDTWMQCHDRSTQAVKKKCPMLKIWGDKE